jgi:predicted Zn-ribbon and HTH transcriptional regulator
MWPGATRTLVLPPDDRARSHRTQLCTSLTHRASFARSDRRSTLVAARGQACRIMSLDMARSHQPPGFEPSRLRRGSREEVQVGAYARRQRRRRILMGLFGALLIAGALALYYQLRPRAEAGAADRYPVCVRCSACGFTARLRVPFTQTFPMECPSCKEPACRVLWECRDCGARFVPQESGKEQRCPQCNSLRVGSAATP